MADPKDDSLELTPEQSELFEANLDRARRAAARLARIMGVDPDEAYSACLRALVYVVRRFDPTRAQIQTVTWRAFFRAVRRVQQLDRVIHIPCRYWDGEMTEEDAAKARRALIVESVFFEHGRPEKSWLIDPAAPEPIEAMVDDERREQRASRIERLLEPLGWRHRIVLKAQARGLSLATIGRCLRLTRERIRQIDDEAKRAVIRHALRDAR
jgi:hypothetical protein